MRTTVEIDERVLDRAKALALKESKTLSAIVSSALAAYVGARRAAAKDEPFELLVRGSARGRFPSVAEMNAVEDAEDAAALGVTRRADP
jgi:predicted transcriptional regulator